MPTSKKEEDPKRSEDSLEKSSQDLEILKFEEDDLESDQDMFFDFYISDDFLDDFYD